MDTPSLEYLNEINRSFYAQTASHFDATRQRPWAGWERLPEHIPARRPLRVLDVGCGNGRFGLWLRDHITPNTHYHGVDNSPALLAYAADALTGLTHVQLSEMDVVTGSPPDGAYDLVALFGVVHHIPGGTQRRDVLRALAERVAPGGVLVFAAWRFWDNPRFRGKTAPWPEGITRESGDHLLDWRRGTVARRYCHHVDDAEHDTLVTATGLQEVARFRADGRDERTNQYSVLRRPPMA